MTANYSVHIRKMNKNSKIYSYKIRKNKEGYWFLKKNKVA